jgi:hypothetical protein
MPRKLPPPFDSSALPAKAGRLHINEDAKGSQADSAPPPLPPPRRQTSMGTGPAISSAAVSIQQKRKPVNNTAASPPIGSKPAVSQTQAAKQKSPPPVAKKPAHLTGSVSPETKLATSAVSEASTVHGPETLLPGLARRATSSVNSSFPGLNRSLSTSPAKHGGKREDAPPPQPPRRVNSSTSIPIQNRMAASGGIPLVGLAGPQEQRAQLPPRKPTSPIPVRPKPQSHAQPVDLLGDDEGMELGGWEALKPSS